MITLNQLNISDRITYNCAAGKLTATVSHVRIGKNGNGKMVPFLNLNVDEQNGKKAHKVELLSGIEMYRIERIVPATK